MHTCKWFISFWDFMSLHFAFSTIVGTHIKERCSDADWETSDLVHKKDCRGSYQAELHLLILDFSSLIKRYTGHGCRLYIYPKEK